MDPVLIGKTLWMTLIGMGLVFVAILILWLLMDLLMRFTAKDAEKEAAAEGGAEAAEIAEAVIEAPVDGLRQKAAAVAVAVALSTRRSAVAVPPAPVNSGSSWQAVNRASQINQTMNLFNRSARGK